MRRLSLRRPRMVRLRLTMVQWLGRWLLRHVTLSRLLHRIYSEAPCACATRRHLRILCRQRAPKCLVACQVPLCCEHLLGRHLQTSEWSLAHLRTGLWTHSAHGAGE